MENAPDVNLRVRGFPTLMDTRLSEFSASQGVEEPLQLHVGIAHM